MVIAISDVCPSIPAVMNIYGLFTAGRATKYPPGLSPVTATLLPNSMNAVAAVAHRSRTRIRNSGNGSRSGTLSESVKRRMSSPPIAGNVMCCRTGGT